LGEGSMGSVAKVKKADSARGGSARAAFVKENQTCCFRCLSWLKLPGGYTEKKFVDATHSRDTSSRDGYSSLSSSLRSSNPAMKSLYGSYPPSRDISQRGVVSSPMPTHKEISETEDLEPPSPLETSPEKAAPPTPPTSNSPSTKQHESNPPRVSPPTTRQVVANPKKLSSQRSSLITYGTQKEVYYALKSIILDRCSSKEFCDELKNEVEILKSLDHPNIVRAIETFNYHNRLFIVLELCSGGDLYTRDPYTEEAARKIITSLFKAVAYLHINGIVHRDLKVSSDQSDRQAV